MPALAVTMLAGLGGAAAGLLALAYMVWFAPRGRSDLPSIATDALSEPRQFLFRNGYLVEHSENIAFLVPTPVDNLKAWVQLIDALSDMADGVEEAFSELQDSGRSFRLTGTLGRDQVLIIGVRQGDDLRITVASAETSQTSMRIDTASLKVLEEDAHLLTRSSDTNPTLSWVVDAEGRVIWCNAAYLGLAIRCAGPDAARGWPMVALFPDEGGAPVGTSRRRVEDREGTGHWFEITTTAPDARDLRHMHALSLDAVISAEDNLRTFIQTLTKTFAYLPTGLAIFDRDRTLAMFNPALMDMTGLDGSWLSRRPKLEDFFDALRDHRKLPEPRDYKAWRDGLSDLSRVDAGGTYSETWTLPNGQTYCVTGRPQADGAVALMLEDVSADVSANRAHREEVEALCGALEATDDALAVFSAGGTRITANAAARHLAAVPDLPETFDACLKVWAARFRPSPVWGDLRSFAKAPMAEAVAWEETLHCDAGMHRTLRVQPLRGGGLALSFALSTGTLAPVSDPVDVDRTPVS
ncbi:PAS-domain containing protein [Jannaschia sp. M317]|uniref:PAS-domain containing protein n=1 Tax=Jannaschia sp. M317 TaxID=2867011 RepID=UPI0021A5A62B|nr:PAS-domain containing protein [Jannaschia sp. M317]UWQ18520.1 PAS-domain containing protein [Jannaschia sp. M317]